MGRYLRIAQIVKARKNKGRLVVRPVDGLPFLLSEGLRVHIVPPTPNAPCTVSVAEAALRGDDYTVVFEGIDDPSILRVYQGRFCLALRDDIDPALLEGEGFALVGFHMRDAALGSVGRISEVREMPGQMMMIVEGRFGTVMVPLVDAFITGVDEQAGILDVDLPTGLVEDAHAH